MYFSLGSVEFGQCLNSWKIKCHKQTCTVLYMYNKLHSGTQFAEEERIYH